MLSVRNALRRREHILHDLVDVADSIQILIEPVSEFLSEGLAVDSVVLRFSNTSQPVIHGWLFRFPSFQIRFVKSILIVA